MALGVIWLIDGLLQLQPYMFGKSFVTGVLLPNAQGQPGIIGEPIRWLAQLIAPHVALFNGFAAAVQLAIGLGLLSRRTAKPALLLSLAWVPGVWFTGEGLGGFFNGTADPPTGAPGAVLLYGLVALLVWPRERHGRHALLGLVGVRGARAILAALWGCFAVLWLLPANDSANSVHDAIAAVPSGAGWLTNLLNAAAGAAAGNGTMIAIALACVSAAIAAAVLSGRHARFFLWLSIAVSGLFWVFGQGFGGILTGSATDVNAAPLMILLAALLLGGLRLAGGEQRTGGQRAAASEQPRLTEHRGSAALDVAGAE